MVLLTSRRIDPVSFFIDEPFFRLGTRNAPKTASIFPSSPGPTIRILRRRQGMPPRKSRYGSRRRHSGPTRAAPSPEVPRLLVVRHRCFSDSDGPERVRQFPDDMSPDRPGENGTAAGSRRQQDGATFGNRRGTDTGPVPRRRNYPSCGCPETIPTTAPKKIVPPACRTAPDSFAGASGPFSDLCDHAVSDTPPPSDSATDTPSPIATQAPGTGQFDDTDDDSRNTDRNSMQLPPVALSVRINLFSTPRRPYLSHKNRQSTSGRTVPPQAETCGNERSTGTDNRSYRSAPLPLTIRKNRPPSLSFLRPSAPDTSENPPVPRTHAVRETGRSVLISPDPVPSPNHPCPDDRNAPNDQRSVGKPLTELLPGRELPYAHQYRHHTEKDGRPITIHDIRYHKHRIGDHQCGPEPESVIFHGIRF